MRGTLDIFKSPNTTHSVKSSERLTSLITPNSRLILMALVGVVIASALAIKPAHAQQPAADPTAISDQVTLTIKTTPPDARIRIMNIKPAYAPGMKVDPGLYHVRIESDGFEPWDNWLKVEGTSFVYPVKLKPAVAAAPATPAPAATTAPSSAKQANPNLIKPPSQTTTTTLPTPQKPKVVAPTTNPAPVKTTPLVIPKVEAPKTPPAQPAPKTITATPVNEPKTKAPPMVVPRKLVPTVPKETAQPDFPQPQFGVPHSMTGGGLVVTVPSPEPTPKTANPASQPVATTTPARPKPTPKPASTEPTSKPPTVVPPRSSNKGTIGKAMQWASGGFGMWTRAISEPNRFLHAAFEPSTAQVVSGATFHVSLLAIALVFFIPLLRPAEGGFGAFAKLFAGTIWTLAATTLIALTVHVAFWILGGESNIAGTYLAYVFSVAPYLPAFGLASLLLAFAFPWHLRHRAINPHSAEKVIKVALTDTPYRSAGLIIGASALAILIPWSLYLTVSSLGFVHKFTFIKCLTAFAVSIPLLGIAYYVNKMVVNALLGHHVDQYDFEDDVDYDTGDPAFGDDNSDEPFGDGYTYEPQPGLEPGSAHIPPDQNHANGASQWATPEQFRPTAHSTGAAHEGIEDGNHADTDADPRLTPPTPPPLSR